MVAAVTPLVGHSTRYRVNRGFQRVIGTFVGLGVTWLIIVVNPTAVVVLLIVALFQGLAELYVARRYALAQVVVTPLALLSGMLVVITVGGQPSLQAAGGLRMISDRAVETVIGAVVGLVCVLIPWLTRRYLWRSDDPGRSGLGGGRRRPPHPMSLRG